MSGRVGVIDAGGFGYLASAIERHSDGSNFLLADGHVKRLRGSQASGGNSATRATNPETGATAERTQGSTSAATFSGT